MLLNTRIVGGTVYVYERCISGEYVKIESDNRDEFLKRVIYDSSLCALNSAPWNLDEVYNSIGWGWNEFFVWAKRIRNKLKRLGLSSEEVRFAAPALVLAKLSEMTLSGVEISRRDCEKNFVYFIFIEDNKKAVKRFVFNGSSSDFDRFRAFSSIAGSAVIKLCGNIKNVKKNKNAVEEFLRGDKSFCKAIVTLKKLGVDPVVDIKRLDKYLNSL